MNAEFPPTITVVALHDPTIDALGFDPTSPYLEHLWLPRIGPSALWTYRRLTAGLRQLDSYTMELAYLAQAIGLGKGIARNSPIGRTLLRLVQFDLAGRPADDTIAVRTKAPWLNQGAVQRLHPHLQRAHHVLLAHHQEQPRKAG